MDCPGTCNLVPRISCSRDVNVIDVGDACCNDDSSLSEDDGKTSLATSSPLRPSRPTISDKASKAVIKPSRTACRTSSLSCSRVASSLYPLGTLSGNKWALFQFSWRSRIFREISSVLSTPYIISGGGTKRPSSVECLACSRSMRSSAYRYCCPPLAKKFETFRCPCESKYRGAIPVSYTPCLVGGTKSAGRLAQTMTCVAPSSTADLYGIGSKQNASKHGTGDSSMVVVALMLLMLLFRTISTGGPVAPGTVMEAWRQTKIPSRF
mmetsp:Transcript_6997/g.17083  ORF Transcript_6997/g.17083 Transcript_6997/m.17083 type:complete len:266 (-) Transcript_6997:1076-1873(-)